MILVTETLIIDYQTAKQSSFQQDVRGKKWGGGVTTVLDWAWTRVIRTRMFLVRNVRVAMRKLPRFQGQTF